MASPLKHFHLGDAPVWWITGLGRFALAGIVCCCHLEFFPGIRDHGWVRLGAAFSGQVALLGFLFLSGYCIAHSLERQPSGFYRRRLLRIVPLYFLAMVAVACLVPELEEGDWDSVHFDFVPATSWQLFGNAVFLQGWTVQTVSFNVPIWSLAVEVFFYLLAPMLRKWKSSLLLLISGGSVVFYLLAYPLGFSFPWEMKWGMPALYLAWPWLWGVVLFRWSKDEPNFSMGVLYAVFGGAVLIAKYGSALMTWSNLPLPLITWGAAVCMVAVPPRQGDENERGRGRVLVGRRLGQYSYPLYLLHFLVFCAAWHWNWSADPLVWLLVAFLLAACSGEFLGWAEKRWFQPKVMEGKD